jgi:hypothetical protein
MRIRGWCAAMLLLVAPVSHADGSLRFTASFKVGAMIPPALLQQSGKPMPTIQPIVSVVRVQGNKEYAGQELHPVIYDFSTQQVTVLDPAGKHYATVNTSDYLPQLATAFPAIPALPPQAKAILQTMKAVFSSQKTGRKDTVLGVPVSESIWTLSLELPASGLPLPGGAASPNGTIVIAKVVAHAWNANRADVANNAALSEVMAHRASALTGLYNPESFLKILSDYPGIHDPLAAVVGGYVNNPPVTLKIEAEIYMPIMAQIAPMMAAQGKLPPDFNPNAPLGEVDVVADQLSDAPIDPAVFQVPGDYTSMPLPDIIKAIAKTTTSRRPPVVYTNQ